LQRRLSAYLDDDLERLLVARSPRFHSLLGKSDHSLQSGKSLSSNDFLEAVQGLL
jgi:hypothetical protein